MYRIISKIEEISGFKDHNNQLFVCFRNGDLFQKDVLVAQNIDGTSLTSTSEFLIFLSNSIRASYFYNGGLKVVDYSIWTGSFYENSILAYSYRNKLFSISILETNTFTKNNIIDGVNLWNFFRYKNILFYFDSSKTLLLSLSLHTGTTLWETDLSAYGKITKIVAVIGERLWVTMSKKVEQNPIDDVIETLVVIDVNTGQEIKSFAHDKSFGAHTVFYSAERGSIIGGFSAFSTRYNMLYEYDVHTLMLKREVSVEALNEANVASNKPQLHGNHLYFVGLSLPHWLHSANHIGVFDIDTLELLWLMPLPQIKFMGSFEVSNNRLYIKGSEPSDLYIYERGDADTTNPETNLNI